MSFRPYKPRDYSSTKGVVTRAYAAVEGGIKRIALLLHRGESQTLSYSDPSTPDEISLDQARILADVSPAAAAVLADDFAALAGGVFLPCDNPGEAFAILAAESAEQWGEFAAMLLRAQADGKLDRIERRDIRVRLDVLLRLLACARAQVVAQESRLLPAGPRA